MTAAQSTPDRELVRTFLRVRDDASFRSLYRRHTPALFRISCRVLGSNPSAAEDVVQEAWIRAVRLLPRFRWQSALRTWLTGIALHCCREHMRSERRRREGPHGTTADPVGPVEVDRLALERALGDLPAGQREILVLHDVEGYTHLEIAETLGIESGTSKSQLSRARSALRRRLGNVDRLPSDRREVRDERR